MANVHKSALDHPHPFCFRVQLGLSAVTARSKGAQWEILLFCFVCHGNKDANTERQLE